MLSTFTNSTRVRLLVEKIGNKNTIKNGKKDASGNTGRIRPEPTLCTPECRREVEPPLQVSPAADDERYARGDAHSSHAAPVGKGEGLFQGGGALERDRLCSVRVHTVGGVCTSIPTQSDDVFAMQFL